MRWEQSTHVYCCCAVYHASCRGLVSFFVVRRFSVVIWNSSLVMKDNRDRRRLLCTDGTAVVNFD